MHFLYYRSSRLDGENCENSSTVVPSDVHLGEHGQITPKRLTAGGAQTDNASAGDTLQTSKSLGLDGKSVQADSVMVTTTTKHSSSTDISNVSRRFPSERISSSETDEKMLIRKTVSSKYDSDQGQMSSDKQGYSDDTSDPSDILSVRRMHHGKLGSIQDTDSACSIPTDSDSTVASSLDGLTVMRKRKDKSSLRKSNLNQSHDDTGKKDFCSKFAGGVKLGIVHSLILISVLSITSKPCLGGFQA